MNHFEKLHNYINENYINLPYDLNYYTERDQYKEYMQDLFEIKNRGTVSIAPPVGLIDFLLPGLFQIKWIINTIWNIGWIVRSFNPKAKYDDLNNFENLEDQIHYDRELDEVVEQVYDEATYIYHVGDLPSLFGKKKDFTDIPFIKQKLLPKFKITSEKQFLDLINEAKNFFKMMASVNKKNMSNAESVKKYMKDLGVEKCSPEEAIRILEFMCRAFSKLYGILMSNYKFHDNIKRKIK